MESLRQSWSVTGPCTTITSVKKNQFVKTLYFYLKEKSNCGSSWQDVSTMAHRVKVKIKNSSVTGAIHKGLILANIPELLYYVYIS